MQNFKFDIQRFDEDRSSFGGLIALNTVLVLLRLEDLMKKIKDDPIGYLKKDTNPILKFIGAYLESITGNKSDEKKKIMSFVNILASGISIIDSAVKINNYSKEKDKYSLEISKETELIVSEMANVTNEILKLKTGNKSFVLSITASAISLVANGITALDGVTDKEKDKINATYLGFIKVLDKDLIKKLFNAAIDAKLDSIDLDDVSKNLNILKSTKILDEVSDTLTKSGGVLDLVFAATEGVLNGINKYKDTFKKYTEDGIPEDLAKRDAFINAITSVIHDTAHAYSKGLDDVVYNGIKTLIWAFTGKEGIKGNYVEVMTEMLKAFNYTNTGDAEDNYLMSFEDNFMIYAYDGNDYIGNVFSNNTIFGGHGSDTIISHLGGENNSSVPKNNSILGGPGQDHIMIYDSNSTVDGGSETDKIFVLGTDNKIYGGDGIDAILLADGANNNTVNGGSGDNAIILQNVKNTVIEYNEGDGNDAILGYDESDTIRINGSYSTQTSGQDVIIVVGNSSISLVGAGGKNININDKHSVIGEEQEDNTNTFIPIPSFWYPGVKEIHGTNGDDEINNGFDNIIINALAGNDTIYNSGENVTINGGVGNDSIRNGEDNVSIDGGNGDDSIYNDTYDDNVSINGGEGNDSIHSPLSDNVSINGGEGNDSISAHGNNININGEDGNDYINTSGENVININGGSGDDFIQNWGSTVSINGGDGDDIIRNGYIYSVTHYGSNALITGGDGDDEIENYGNNVSIDGGAGNDCIYNDRTDNSIHNGGENVTINGGDGDDSIRNGGSNVSINGGAGDDYISNGRNDQVDNVLIDGGEGNDSIYNDYSGDATTILGGDGNDSIDNSGENVSIDSGDGNDTIDNSGENVTINGGDGDDSITNILYVDNVTINGGDGDDSISNGGNNVIINGGSGNDYIDNRFIPNVTINGGTGDDYIHSYGGNVSIDSGDGDDSIDNGGNNVTINGGDGDDSITNNYYGDNVSINGGDGNDTIGNEGNNVSINGGEGDDIVSLHSYENVIQYNLGDGNDLIYNFNSDDTLSINGEDYTSLASGNDIILGVGTGSITLIGAAQYSNLNIIGTLGETDTTPADTTPADTTPADTTPADTTPADTTPADTTPADTTPADTTPADTTPADTTPADTTPADTTPADTTPADTTPADTTPADTTPADTTPADTTPADTGVTLSNTVNDTLITGTAYNDSIVNSGERVTIQALGGNDSIINDVDSSVTAASVGNSIDAGDGDDYIFNHHTYNPTLLGGKGNDSIVISRGHLTYIDGGAGNDSILGQYSGTDTSDWTTGGYATIYGGDGDDYIAPGYTNDSSIDGGEGDDTIITNGNNETVDGGNGNNLIVLTTFESGETGQYVVMNGKTTVEGFKLGFDEGSDTVYFTGDYPSVDFKSEGLTFYTDDDSIALSGIDSTAKVNLYSLADDKLEHGVYIADDDWYNVTDLELSTTDNLYYVGATAKKNHGLNFNAVTSNLNVTIDTDYDAETPFYVNNIYSVKGGAGNTTITGSEESDTIISGSGKTTINAGTGGDILTGNGQTFFNIDEGATATVNALAGDTISTNDDTLTFIADGMAYIVNGTINNVSDNAVLESDSGEVIAGSNLEHVTIVDGTAESLTSDDKEILIGKRGASLTGYTLDKAFIVDAENTAYLFDKINGTTYILDEGTFRTENQGETLLDGYDTSKGTFVTFKTGDGKKVITGWSPLNGGLVDGNDIDKEQLLFGDAPDGNSSIRGGMDNDTILAGAKDVVSVSGGHDDLYINDETSHGVTVDLGDGTAESRTKIIQGFDVAKDLLKVDSPENINARILDGSLQFIKGDSRVTFDELATFDDANGLQLQIDGVTYELRNDYDSGLANVDYLWTDTDGNYYLTDSTFSIHDDGTREYFIAEGSGRIAIDDFKFGRDNDKLNVTAIDGLKTYGDNLYIESGDNDVVEVVNGAGKTIDIKIDGTTYTAQLGKHLTYDLDAQYYGDLQGDLGSEISVAANFAHEEIAIYLNEEEEADGKVRYYGGVTKIDASAFSGQASLVGSEFNDKIIAAQGATSLWGGESGDDELFGTGTDNTFFYCKGDGDDKIYNAANEDTVNLVDITLEDIKNSAIAAEAVTIEFNDGGRLTVMNSADVTFNLGDGTSWKADRQANEWNQQS